MRSRRDSIPLWVNIAGAIALALVAAMSIFFWTHPHYTPPCASTNWRGKCTPAVPEEMAPLAP